jgi:hypothetical protein
MAVLSQLLIRSKIKQTASSIVGAGGKSAAIRKELIDWVGTK